MTDLILPVTLDIESCSGCLRTSEEEKDEVVLPVVSVSADRLVAPASPIHRFGDLTSST